METFYTADPEVMRRLGRFLEVTRGKPLVLLCVDEQGDEFFDDYQEFETGDLFAVVKVSPRSQGA